MNGDRAKDPVSAFSVKIYPGIAGNAETVLP